MCVWGVGAGYVDRSRGSQLKPPGLFVRNRFVLERQWMMYLVDLFKKRMRKEKKKKEPRPKQRLVEKRMGSTLW